MIENLKIIVTLTNNEIVQNSHSSNKRIWVPDPSKGFSCRSFFQLSIDSPLVLSSDTSWLIRKASF